MHKHLTWTDRLKIEKGLKEGLKPCAIADRLHVHNTTIYRELKRGTLYAFEFRLDDRRTLFAGDRATAL